MSVITEKAHQDLINAATDFAQLVHETYPEDKVDAGLETVLSLALSGYHDYHHGTTNLDTFTAVTIFSNNVIGTMAEISGSEVEQQLRKTFSDFILLSPPVCGKLSNRRGKKKFRKDAS